MSRTNRTETEARHEYIVCLLVVLFSLAWWFSPYLLHGHTFLSEAGQMLWADWVIARKIVLNGNGVSEWNPYILFGVNYVGREAFFHPLNLGALAGHLILGDKFSFMAVTLMSLAVMGMGMYVFLRSLAIRPAFARIGAVVYLLAPKWTDDGYHGPHFVVGYAILPFILLLIFRMYAARFRKLSHFVALAVLEALMYLAIGAAFTVIQLYLTGSFFCYLLYRRRKEDGREDRMLLVRTAGYVAVAATLCLGFSAYLLLPFVHNYLFAYRSAYGDSPGFSTAEYLGLIFPWLNRMYGRGVYDLPYPAVLPILAPNLHFYMGILAIPVLTMGFARRLWTPLTGFFAVTFVAWLALWNGYLTAAIPILQWIERLTHGEASQYHGHIILIFSISVVIAAGLQAIDDRHEEIWKGRAGRYLGWLNMILIAVYLAAAGVFAAGALVLGTNLKVYFWSHVTVGHYLFLHYYLREMAATFLAIFLVRATIVWMYHRRRFVGTWGSTALLILLIADFQLVFRTIYPFTDLDARYDTGRLPNSFVLEHTHPLDRIGASQFQVAASGPAARLDALVAMPAPADYGEVVRRFGALYYQGFKKPLFEPSFSYFPIVANRSFYGFHESLMPEYFWDFDRALNQGHPRYERGSFIGLWDPHSPLLDVAGIKYLFWHEKVEDDRFTEVAHYALESHVYVNQQAVPRAYLVPRVEHYPSRGDLMRRMQEPTFRPREVVTTEDEALADAMKGGDPAGSTGDARIDGYTPDRVVVNVDAPARSVLVLNDMYYPNWTARIDGEESTIYRVNGTFRGVIVPEGTSTVVFRYYDSAFHTGLMISAATWLFAGLLLVTSGRTRGRHVELAAALANP